VWNAYHVQTKYWKSKKKKLNQMTIYPIKVTTKVKVLEQERILILIKMTFNNSIYKLEGNRNKWPWATIIKV